jgi:pimeloyl-ACP methyl ester carboxylesterase
MTQPGTSESRLHCIGSGGRMRVFDSAAEPAAFAEASSAGHRPDRDSYFAELEKLADLLDDQTVCFIGKGQVALAALEAADKASAASIRVIVESPTGIASADLGWFGQSTALQRSDILILMGSATGSDTDASARLLKSRLPRATLMFVYGAGHDIARDRPDLYLRALGDFVRRGSSFVMRS